MAAMNDDGAISNALEEALSIASLPTRLCAPSSTDKVVSYIEPPSCDPRRLIDEREHHEGFILRRLAQAPGFGAVRHRPIGRLFW